MSSGTPIVKQAGRAWTSLSDLAEVCPPLVPYPCLGEEAARVALLKYTQAQVYVFAKAHIGKTAQLAINLGLETHVEASWVKFVQFLLSAPDTAGSQKGSHRVADGLLYGREAAVGLVGAAPGIAWLLAELTVHLGEIALRYYAV